MTYEEIKMFITKCMDFFYLTLIKPALFSSFVVWKRISINI